MDERKVLWAGGAVAVLMALVTVVWVLLSPGWAGRWLADMAQQQLGRAFSATGSIHLDISPMAIRIEEPVLAGLTDTGSSLMTARSMVIPVTLGELLSGRATISRLALHDAEFALLIDERGQASWDFPEATAGQAMDITLQQATIRYFDARNGQTLTISNVDGLMRITADGAISFEGTAVISSHVARVNLDLKSLPRVNADGSPLELVLESDAASASFSGRLATAKVLSLAGPVSLTSREPEGIARWVGIALSDSDKLPGPLNLNGGLDSAGRAIAVRNAGVTLGEFRATGDVVADLRAARPKLQLNLDAETVWLDALLPAAGAGAQNWGRAVLPVQMLRSIDAEVNILSRAAAFGSYGTGPARFAATLTDGRLEASGALRLANGGTGRFTTKVDAVVLPPAGSLTITAETAELGPLFAALGPVTALSGVGNLSVDVSALGRTQEELISTLKGTASMALQGGRIAGLDADGIIAAVRERILDGWTALPGNTALESVTVSAEIADGLATLAPSPITIPGLTFTLSGTVDLLRRAVDLKAELPENAPLPVPVLIAGNWGAPRIYPDIPDILNNPEGGFARLRIVDMPAGN
jgi:uncharacterized protein involved in outer membrane biogenesis